MSVTAASSTVSIDHIARHLPTRGSGDEVGLSPLEESHPHGRTARWDPADGRVDSQARVGPGLGSLLAAHGKYWPAYAFGSMLGFGVVGAGGLALADKLGRGGPVATKAAYIAGGVAAMGVSALLANRINRDYALNERARGADVIVGAADVQQFLELHPEYRDEASRLGVASGIEGKPADTEFGEPEDHFAEVIVDSDRGVNIVFDNVVGTGDIGAISGHTGREPLDVEGLKDHLDAMRAERGRLDDEWSPAGQRLAGAFGGGVAGAIIGGLVAFKGLAAPNPGAGMKTGMIVGGAIGAALGAKLVSPAENSERAAAEKARLDEGIDRVERYLATQPGK